MAKDKTPEKSEPKIGFNAKITKFFLNNSRLTILLLALITILGLVSTFSLKTTGFPSPTINVLLVQSVYPGASSETIKEQVSKPIEEAIREVDGIDTYSSTSSESVSILSLNLLPSADLDSVRTRVDSALKGVDLPEDATSPSIRTIDIAGGDYIFSLIAQDPKSLYELSDQLSNEITSLANTSDVEITTPVLRRLEITLDNSKINNKFISVDQIYSQLESLGEEIPVGSNIVIDETSQSITTLVEGDDLAEIRNLRVEGTEFNQFGVPTTKTFKLSQLASFELTYEFDGKTTYAAVSTDNGEAIFDQALIITVSTVDGVDSAVYDAELRDVLKEFESIEFVELHEQASSDYEASAYLIENFSVNDDNQQQVDEVAAGLFGGPLDIENEVLAQLGWLLGGIQLVFIIMMLFVSVRAAIVAALSIPLSLIFSTIYLYAFGFELNTLVLFSLVLVIGLVVDPALVTLESIQRKIDIGYKGKEAAIAAVKDVGAGLFLAAVTNVIVFAPFGVISGFIGEIFSYIPLTIIPAIIGSYIVPLVFLAWFGGIFLRKSKGKSKDEEKNLWPISKALISANTRILNTHWLVRVAIIVVAIVTPLATAGYFFGSGQVVFVQFSGSETGSIIQTSGTYLAGVTQDTQESIEQDLAKNIAEIEGVNVVFNSSSGPNFYIRPEAETSRTTIEIRDDVRELLAEYESEFFSIKADIASFTPSGEEYQVTIAIKEEDTSTLRSAAMALGEELYTICENEEGEFELGNIDCDDENQVVVAIDDGYTGKESEVLEVRLDRTKLANKNLLIDGAPQSLLVNRRLREVFGTDENTVVTTALVEGQETDVIIVNEYSAPKTKSAIRNLEVTNLAGKKVKISEVGEVVSVTAPSSIARENGETVGIVRLKLSSDYGDQGSASLVTQAIIDHYNNQDTGDENTAELGLEAGSISTYEAGGVAEFAKSFTELITALMLAIFLSYLVLVVFFESFTQPIVILFTVPLTFLGVFPALAFLGTGELGFLEIIGLIILVGIVENVAIFLIDLARQKINEDGWDDKRAIAYAAGVRFRPVVLTTITAIVSLTPLAFTSELYRPISLVIIFGLVTSGVTSLFTTPILFVFFRAVSRKVRGQK